MPIAIERLLKLRAVLLRFSVLMVVHVQVYELQGLVLVLVQVLVQVLVLMLEPEQVQVQHQHAQAGTQSRAEGFRVVLQLATIEVRSGNVPIPPPGGTCRHLSHEPERIFHCFLSGTWGYGPRGTASGGQLGQQPAGCSKIHAPWRTLRGWCLSTSSGERGLRPFFSSSTPKLMHLFSRHT